MTEHDINGPEAAALRLMSEDATPETAAAFAALVTSYYEHAWAGTGAVSPRAPASAAAARLGALPPRAGTTTAELVQRLAEDVVAQGNRLAHPMAMGHQVAPPLPAAVWAEPLISAMNQSLAVREMSPAGTLIERGMIAWLADLAGLGPDAGGTFTSGGTEANFTALLAARAAAMPDAWQHGVGPDPPIIVCGEHAHYSISRAAGQLGIGVASVITVPTRGHRLDVAALPDLLDRGAAAGRRIMAVVASAGSTATGTFDEIDRIAAVCEDRGLWLHVDAAHGGSALLSQRHRARLRGIERADSIAWDPHKMMLLPIPCSVVLLRDEARLDAAFAQAAPYLFHAEGRTRSQDQGVRSFACSRRLEALKLWVVLHRYGTDGLAALYDRLCRMAAALHERVERHPAFTALHAPESNILCFRWIGDGAAAALDDAALDARNLEIRNGWNESGDGWITSTVLDGRRVLRVTIMNPRTAEPHLDALLDGLAERGRRCSSTP
jgi:L-2,4-diaminobutyrate decarboxylase